MRKIILASESPRRKEILGLTGLEFSVFASDYEESFNLKLKPRALARKLSRKKAEAVAPKHRNAIIIAADTFIVFKDKLLGKPRNTLDAGRMLKMLSGKVHSVITGCTIIDTANGNTESLSEETKVYFKKLSSKDIAAYVKSGEPLGKAGAYAIQGLGAVLIEKIEGDFFNVVGLPLSVLTERLKKFGVPVLK